MNDEESVKLIEATLNKVRPFLQRDGGDIEFIGFKDGIVYVSLTGACAGCMLADDDISGGIEIILMQEVPGVIAVKGSNIPEDVMTAYYERKSALNSAK